MKTLLKLEDGSRSDRAITARSLASIFGKPPNMRPWVARLDGYDEQYHFKREFLDAQVDYSEANSVLTRYVYMYFVLEYGYAYEAYNPMGRRTGRWPQMRFFCAPDTGGNLLVISEGEAKRIVSTNSFIRGPRRG